MSRRAEKYEPFSGMPAGDYDNFLISVGSRVQDYSTHFREEILLSQKM